MNGRFPFQAPVMRRAFPTLRQTIKGGGGRRTKAPWYKGFPGRTISSWAAHLKRK